ncbi:MAG: epoxyqueuosine reductase [Desulfobacterales bacterium]|jgi:hypothetical protein|nr:epoxyqueuosine reductase [Desulfobacterales bacterium]
MKMKDRYRKVSFITDFRGIKNAIGELRGWGHPPQPKFNAGYQRTLDDPVLNEDWFINHIKEKIANHPENAMEYPFYGEKIFADPLVGFIRGNDPIFQKYKTLIGPHHFTPEGIMQWQAQQNGVPAPEAQDLSVVSFILPLSQITKNDNAAMKDWPAQRWAQTRLLGEIFSQIFVREIVTHLMERGLLAIAPDVTPMFNKKRYPKVGWASPWSHRHIAYAAGLGTFGIHDFLITEKGCAHRTGSFVVNLKLKPNRKPPDDIHAYCLQYQGKKCMQCAKRCPVNAITAGNAHDKEACYKRVAKSLVHCNKNYHIFIYGCGLCSTGVPCESEIPKALQQ